jgi:hypothetical protein
LGCAAGLTVFGQATRISATCSMQTGIAKAVTIIRNSPDLEDEEIHGALIEAGLESQLAARIVEFLPTAYCRVLLAHSGVHFAKTFQRCRSDGSFSEHLPLESEPVWSAAIEFAHWEVEQGITSQEQVVVAARSAEFQAINDLLNGGSKLENLALTSIVLRWPEEGP